MYIKTPSAAVVDRRHIFFYFGTLNYRPCGRSRTPNRRAVHHRCFIFTWEIHFSRWATLIVTPHLGRIAAPSKTHTHTRSDQTCDWGRVNLCWEPFSPLGSIGSCLPFGTVSGGRDSLQVQSKRFNQKLRSKVSELYSQPTAATLIGRRLGEEVGGGE